MSLARPRLPSFHGEPPSHLTSPLLAEAGLPHLFTTRHFPGLTGRAEPTSPFGREALATLAQHGLDGEPPAFARQVHGGQVIAAKRGGHAGAADALMTDRAALPLAIFTADCLGIIIFDPVLRRLCVVHAGWRGTVQAVTRAAVHALIGAGGKPETFVAAVGPSIGPCCYEVDRPVIDRLEAAFPRDWATWAASRGEGKWMLDLWAANEDQLRAAGLEPHRIDNPRLCTSCRLDLFFSYRRRSGRGRLAAVAALPGSRAAPTSKGRVGPTNGPSD